MVGVAFAFKSECTCRRLAPIRPSDRNLGALLASLTMMATEYSYNIMKVLRIYLISKGGIQSGMFPHSNASSLANASLILAGIASR